MVKFFERIGLVELLYGRADPTLYLTRIKLTPMTRWGGLYLHVFLRGDEDPDPHDHPWHFWTWPINRSYWEAVMDPDGIVTVSQVGRRRWTRRSAVFTHRLLCPLMEEVREYRPVAHALSAGMPRPKLYTLVWHGPKVRSWGFWVLRDSSRNPWGNGKEPEGCVRGGRVWVHWRQYILGEQWNEEKRP